MVYCFIIVYLDDILISIKDLDQPHVKIIRWVLDQFQKHVSFGNLKKQHFHKDKVLFSGYLVSIQGVRMKDGRIKMVKTQSEPQSVQNIQVFISFTNFYRQFIKGFNKIASSLTLILGTTLSTFLSIRSFIKAVNLDGSEMLEVVLVMLMILVVLLLVVIKLKICQKSQKIG